MSWRWCITLDRGEQFLSEWVRPAEEWVVAHDFEIKREALRYLGRLMGSQDLLVMTNDSLEPVGIHPDSIQHVVVEVQRGLTV